MEFRVELFARIRRDARVEGLSIRALARRHGVGRPTVRQALAQAEPPARRPRVRTAPRLDAFKSAIDLMLREDLDGPRKQKHTARRVFARLAEEYGAAELSYSTVRDYVRRRRPEIDVEAGRLPEVVQLAPGASAYSTIHFSNAAAYHCATAVADVAKVSPPNWDSSRTITLESPVTVCNTPATYNVSWISATSLF